MAGRSGKSLISVKCQFITLAAGLQQKCLSKFHFSTVALTRKPREKKFSNILKAKKYKKLNIWRRFNMNLPSITWSQWRLNSLLEGDRFNAPVRHVLGAIYERNDDVSKSWQWHTAGPSVILRPSVPFTASEIDQMQPGAPSVDWGEKWRNMAERISWIIELTTLSAFFCW